MSQQDQQAIKEEARREALKYNVALERRGNKVEAVDQYGNREILSDSAKQKDVWTEALKALLSKSDVEVSTSKSKLHHKVTIYSDGGSRGNPGPSASGFVIYDEKGKLLEEGGEYLGITTNNQAEYQSLKLALEKATVLNVEKVIVRMDSLLVVNQMKGTFKVKNKDLWPVHTSIKLLVEQFDRVVFEHVPRSANKVADSMVNKILDAQVQS